MVNWPGMILNLELMPEPGRVRSCLLQTQSWKFRFLNHNWILTTKNFITLCMKYYQIRNKYKSEHLRSQSGVLSIQYTQRLNNTTIMKSTDTYKSVFYLILTYLMWSPFNSSVIGAGTAPTLKQHLHSLKHQISTMLIILHSQQHLLYSEGQ